MPRPLPLGQRLHRNSVWLSFSYEIVEKAGCGARVYPMLSYLPTMLVRQIALGNLDTSTAISQLRSLPSFHGHGQWSAVLFAPCFEHQLRIARVSWGIAKLRPLVACMLECGSAAPVLSLSSRFANNDVHHLTTGFILAVEGSIYSCAGHSGGSSQPCLLCSWF